MIALALAAAIAAPQNVPVVSITGNDLWDVCSESSIQGSACSSYIAGALDTFAMMERVSGVEDGCVPEAATYRQVTDMIVQQLRDNPGDRDVQAAIIIFVAARQAFGCSMDFLQPAEPAPFSAFR